MTDNERRLLRISMEQEAELKLLYAAIDDLLQAESVSEVQSSLHVLRILRTR